MHDYVLKINSMDYKEIIDEIIKETFKVIKDVYDNQRESKPKVEQSSPIGSRIIFPKYFNKNKEKGKSGNKEDRISEQELRFIFVEQLEYYLSKNNISNIYYSVETPTENKYVFPEEGSPRVADEDDKNNKKGVSARMDLVIYIYEKNEFKKVALIEFKALNPIKGNYEKDFCKLNHEGEEGILKYFIQIVKNYDGGTIESIKDKIESKEENVIYKCYCLDHGKKIEEEIINYKPKGE